MQKHKSTFYIFLLVANATLGTFLFGYMIGIFNPTQETIEIINGWGDTKSFYDGLVTGFFIIFYFKQRSLGLMPIGAIVGAYLSAFLSIRIGRRNTFILADLIGIIGCVIWIFKGNALLFIGRFLGGIAVGLNSAIVPVYINEMSPLSISGSMGSMTQLTINLGILISFLLGLNIPNVKEIKAAPDDQWWWRFMYGFPIITCALRTLVFLFFFNFETPSYLVMKGKDEESKEIIKKLYYEVHEESIYNEIKVKISNYKDVSLSELTGKKYRKRLSIGIILSVIQQFSGVNAVLFYSDKIFKGDKPSEEVDPFDDKMAKIFTILIGLILTFASWLSGKFIDRFGRKSILLLGEVFCIITLGLLTILGFLEIDSVSRYIILLFMFSFGISLGPIVWIYVPEILPERGVSMATLANWVSCGIIGLCFPIVKNAVTIQGTFLIFLGCCVAALFYMFFFIKETKGKTSEEVEQMFAGDTLLLVEEKDTMSGNTSIPI